MAVNEEFEQKLRELQRSYVEFLDDSDRDGIYDKLVREMIDNKSNRLIVSINDLRQAAPERTRVMMTRSFEEISAFQRALKEFVGSIDATYAKEAEDFYVGFEGSFGAKHVTPRTLTSRNLGNLVCLEGIITKCSLVRPKVVKSVHYCPATQKTMERSYTDMTSFDPFPSTAAYPTQDDAGNKLETEYGLSRYKDHQTLTIQEMPEKAPAGQLPRSVDVVADNDLVDLGKPGDRVQIIGSYRAMPGKKGGYTNGTFKCLLIANNIALLSKEVTPSITGEDVAKCKKFAKQKGDVFAMLAKSLAPSIHGHEYIKQALLCQLLGGVEKNLPNGTRLRGDINLLLIGDPSVAKSQLLRYTLHTAPRAITTTGRGSSGVGLTAAVTTDQESGERRLEAGAMVLADRGIVCIDEFDKMTDMDRTAIHEVMEQGRVTISKAGIHARLNARCSVLAAANPVYGRYNPYKTPMENIGLQDSLLSRFDCLFIMLDTIDVDSDRKIADHVVRMHRYRNPREQDGQVLMTDAEAEVLSTMDVTESNDEDGDTPVYEKYDALLHGNSRKKTDKVVSVQFMKKYIHIAKCIRPVLSQEASEILADEYANLRASDFEAGVARTQPVTPRALETLIRLSTAHAKSRLSKVVEEQDAELAIQLVQFAYFKKVLEKPGKKKAGNESDDGEEEVEERADDTPSKRRRKVTEEEESSTPTSKRARVEKSSPEKSQEEVVSTSTSSTTTIPEARLKQFMALLQKCISEKNNAESLELQVIKTFFAKTEKKTPFTDNEIDACIEKMSEDNKLMRSDDTIFVI